MKLSNKFMMLLLPCSLMACEPEYPWPFADFDIENQSYYWIDVSMQAPEPFSAVFARDLSDNVWVGHWKDGAFYPTLKEEEWPRKSIVIRYWSNLLSINK